MEEEESLNPLHCGAVVASVRTADVIVAISESQSPSLRGSGRFSAGGADTPPRDVSQSPSLRGSGRFARGRRSKPNHGRGVSIPFIAGQWSLRKESLPASEEAGRSQSPSLRGSGRFRMAARRG